MDKSALFLLPFIALGVIHRLSTERPQSAGHSIIYEGEEYKKPITYRAKIQSKFKARSPASYHLGDSSQKIMYLKKDESVIPVPIYFRSPASSEKLQRK